MEHTPTIEEHIVDDQVLDVVAVSDDAVDPTRDERGMATVEYAIGIVLVVTIVGLIIAAIQGDWFGPLVKILVKAIFDMVKVAIGG